MVKFVYDTLLARSFLDFLKVILSNSSSVFVKFLKLHLLLIVYPVLVPDP